MASLIRSFAEDGIRRIVLDRPPANAINHEMLEAICTAFDEANDDWDTKVVILESSLERFFCAGADVKGPRPEPDPRRDHLRVPNSAMEQGRRAFAAIYNCQVPVITKITGTAVGSGVLFATLADVAVVSETAKLGLFEVKIGAVGGMGVMRRALSEQAVRYLMWSARLVEAAELRRLGAGMVIVAPEEVDGEVERLAAEICALEPDVIRYTKAAFNEVERGDPLGAYQVEQKYTALMSARRSAPR